MSGEAKQVCMLGDDEVSVSEETVTIRVLRIGKRQLTRSIFQQLMQKHLMDRESGQLKGNIWGWVVHRLRNGDHQHLVLFESGGELFWDFIPNRYDDDDRLEGPQAEWHRQCNAVRTQIRSIGQIFLA